MKSGGQNRQVSTTAIDTISVGNSTEPLIVYYSKRWMGQCRWGIKCNQERKMKKEKVISQKNKNGVKLSCEISKLSDVWKGERLITWGALFLNQIFDHLVSTPHKICNKNCRRTPSPPQMQSNNMLAPPVCPKNDTIAPRSAPTVCLSPRILYSSQK